VNQTFLKALLNWLLVQFKGEVIKLALKKILGSAMIAGPKAWIIKFVVSNLWDEIAEPLIRAGLVELEYVYDKHQGKVLIKKLNQAEENNDQITFDDIVDDIYN